MLFDLKMPLLGFESIQKMQLQKIDDIFMRLKTPDTNEPSFILINPFILREYTFDIPTAVQRLMEIDEKSNLLIYNIVVIQNPIEKSVVNFLAPIVFNTDNHTMAQIILSDSAEYGIAEPISTFLEAKSNA
jgi:flagellar assembly factor FliW